MSKGKSVFITGVTGQMGSYLVDMYLAEGYRVYGLTRRSSTNNTERIKHNLGNQDFEVVEGDLNDYSSLLHSLQKIRPSLVVNCAAQSHVATSFKEPLNTFQTTGAAVFNLLEVCRSIDNVRFLQFSSSEMFGDQFDLVKTYYGTVKCQDENTLMNPQSPYAIAKLAAYNAVRLYRRAYNMFASNIIMFNTESPRRGENFVTRKISKYVARLYAGLEDDYLYLGNLDAVRDWSHALDNVEAVRLILNHHDPDDFVVGTGKRYSVREFLEEAFRLINRDYNNHVVIDEQFMRPAEVPYLCANPDKIKKVLKWEPAFTFDQLVLDMVSSDLEACAPSMLLPNSSLSYT